MTPPKQISDPMTIALLIGCHTCGRRLAETREGLNKARESAYWLKDYTADDSGEHSALCGDCWRELTKDAEIVE